MFGTSSSNESAGESAILATKVNTPIERIWHFLCSEILNGNPHFESRL